MGTYNLSKDEIKENFKDWMTKQEGEIHADVMVETWNELAEENHWGSKLVKLEKGFMATTKTQLYIISISLLTMGIAATAIFYNVFIL